MTLLLVITIIVAIFMSAMYYDASKQLERNNAKYLFEIKMLKDEIHRLERINKTLENSFRRPVKMKGKSKKK